MQGEVLSIVCGTKLLDKVQRLREGRPVSKSMAARALLELGVAVAQKLPEAFDEQLLTQLNKEPR